MNYLQIKQEAENRILKIRSREVMLDKDVAELYDIETAELNRKVKNNPEKFTGDLYVFDLNKEEKHKVIEAYPRLEGLKHAPNIKAYTEYGILMLATTFQKSNDVAIQICHILVQTFVEYKSKQKSVVTGDSLIAEIKKDVELLKNFALNQFEANNQFDEHFQLIFKEITEIKGSQNPEESPKNEIGFKK